TAAEYLRAAEEALRYPEGPGREIQDAAPRLIATVPAASAQAARMLASYLAAAPHAGEPSLFAKQVAWLRADGRADTNDTLRRVEDVVVRDLDLRPVAVALPAARGRWKGGAVEIAARAYAGGAFRFCRFIELSGAGLQIGNALCLPRFDVPAPIFGVDLVAP